MTTKFLVLKKKFGNQWYLVAQETGITVTGPHRWGSITQAVANARAFASTWNYGVILDEGLSEHPTRLEDPIPAADEPS